MNYKDTKTYLNESNFIPSKKMGQNFLVDQNVQQLIVDLSDIQLNEWILEIGPGLGAISKYLYLKTKNLILVELDKRLYEHLVNQYKDIVIINNDILKVDLNGLKTRYNFNSIKVVANIPYSISSKIILYLLKYDFINQINLLVQTEMAEHLCAKVNDQNYNGFTVLVNFYYETKILLNVSKNCFIPIPEIESSFIELKRINKYNDLDFNKISNLLKVCFSFKRKTLLNNLSKLISKQEIIKIFEKLNLDLNIRSQELTNDDFYHLYKLIYENNK